METLPLWFKRDFTNMVTVSRWRLGISNVELSIKYIDETIPLYGYKWF